MSKWSGLGLNYGHVYPGSLSTTQIANDLALFQSLGITRLRIAVPSYTSTGSPNSITTNQALVEQAIAAGFTVIWGVDNPSPAESATFGNFLNALIALAPWAAGLGSNFILQLGNEEDANYKISGGDMTSSQVQTLLLETAATIKTSYPSLLLSVSIASNSLITAWNDLDITNLDYIGFDIYATYSSFCSIVASYIATFGAKAIVTEFNDVSGFFTTNNELDYANNISALKKFLANSGIGSAYFFNYNHTTNAYGIPNAEYNLLLEDGATYRDAWAAISGQRYISPTRSFTKPTNSLYFGNNTSVVSGNDNGALQNLTALTVECWINLLATPSYTARIFAYSQNNRGFWLAISPGSLVPFLQVGNGTSEVQTNGNQAIQTGWNHVAGTWDESNIYIWVNGVKYGTGVAISGNTKNPEQSWYIGNNTINGNRGLPGYLQELRISNILRYTANFTPITHQFISDSNTLALWHLNEGSGNTIYDSSGNALTGTLSGSPLPQWSSGYIYGPGGGVTRPLINRNRSLIATARPLA